MGSSEYYRTRSDEQLREALRHATWRGSDGLRGLLHEIDRRGLAKGDEGFGHVAALAREALGEMDDDAIELGRIP